MTETAAAVVVGTRVMRRGARAASSWCMCACRKSTATTRVRAEEFGKIPLKYEYKKR